MILGELIFFDRCLVRTPFFPIGCLYGLHDINAFAKTDAAKNAIYIASESLYNDVYIKTEITEKVACALARYYIRACSRCTPYGMFAGCMLADVKSSDSSGIIVDEDSTYKSYTRLDMNVLCDISRIIERDPKIRKWLKYHVNSSMYELSDSYRYIEYSIKKNKRRYILSEISKSDYFKDIYDFVKTNERSIEEIASILVSPDVKYEDAFDFVNELIDEQIIVSNLEPSVAGDDLVRQLSKGIPDSSYRDNMLKIEKLLSEIDESPFEHRIGLYDNLSSLVKNQYHIKSNNILHVDCKIKSKEAIIGNDIKNAFTKGLTVLRHFGSNENMILDKFKREFYDRYEEEEIPLVVALDSQVGVPIGKWNSLVGDKENLLDGIFYPTELFDTGHKHTAIDILLSEKYDEYISGKVKCINLTKSDMDRLPVVKDNGVQAQYTSMIQVINIGENGGEAEIFMDSTSTGNASKLLSRFSYLDKNINEFVSEINRQEEANMPDCILAEILHLPEDRIGNIQMHPIQRKYAIPYFSNPTISEEEVMVIPIDDIVVSVPQGRCVKLKSLKYNKEIIPVLTTAHNYSTGLPIYLFLCILQSQHDTYYSFQWPHCLSVKSHLPQVRYENIILSPEKWGISQSDIYDEKKIKDKNEIFDKVSEWRVTKGIPSKVVISEGDNKLLIDFDNKIMFDVFVEYLQTHKKLLIEEFLFANTTRPLVERHDGWFVNEIVLSATYNPKSDKQ